MATFSQRRDSSAILECIPEREPHKTSRRTVHSPFAAALAAALTLAARRVESLRGVDENGELLFAGGFHHLSGASVRSLAPFPTPASSYAACGFPALRTPVHFIPRVMGPIEPGALSAVAAWDETRGNARTGPACRTATAYSTSSSRTPCAAEPASSAA